MKSLRKQKNSRNDNTPGVPSSFDQDPDFEKQLLSQVSKSRHGAPIFALMDEFPVPRRSPYFSISTPRQKATKPLILRAAGLGSG